MPSRPHLIGFYSHTLQLNFTADYFPMPIAFSTNPSLLLPHFIPTMGLGTRIPFFAISHGYELLKTQLIEVHTFINSLYYAFCGLPLSTLRCLLNVME